MSKFDLTFSLTSLNRSALTSTSMFSLRSSPLSNESEEEQLKPNSSLPLSVVPVPDKVAVPSPGPSSLPIVSSTLTIDPAPALRTIDGPTPKLSLATSGTGPEATHDSGKKAVGALTPKALSNYIPASAASGSSSSSSASTSSNVRSATRPIASSGPFGFILPQINSFKSALKLDAAHSAFSARHARAKANAKKLGALGRKVLEERCGARCEIGMSAVGQAFGGWKVGIRGVGAVGNDVGGRDAGGEG